MGEVVKGVEEMVIAEEEMGEPEEEMVVVLLEPQ
mgnify:CR=1 FL=1